MKGFTLIETIFSVSILAAIAVGSLTLVSKSVQSVSVSQNRLIASYLAQEGIEIIRNIRDGNWEDEDYPIIIDWDNGLSNCADCEIDYTMNSLADGGDPFLKLDSDNFYNYSSGSDTIFQRRISVSSVSEQQKRVIAEIAWKYRGNDYSLAVETVLYNWW